MSNKKFKTKTLCLIDTMIEHADQGPSGFWVQDHEGCGNPKIFPEFEEGLRKGSLVQKEHYLCPWNTAILFGTGRGNIHTGCYHSCSISEAKYFPSDRLRQILGRFKKGLSSGVYDNLENLKPLLTDEERSFLEKAKESNKKEQERKWKEDAQRKREAAGRLIRRFKDDPDAQEIVAAHYGENVSVMTYEYGWLHFSPESMKNIVGGDKLTYDDYLEIQIKSHGKIRTAFQQCYFECGLEYCGEIEKKTKDTVCFKRILIRGMHSDGIMFDEKEEHVWMDAKGFEDFAVGDCVSFAAEVYRYIKTSKGKVLDYGLRNPAGIKKIDPYKLPTDAELQAQAMALIQCEACYLNEHCNRSNCILNSFSKARKRKGNSK